MMGEGIYSLLFSFIQKGAEFVKVKALIDCVGIRYNLKTGETADLNKKVAEKLINFGYVEEVKSRKHNEKSDE